MLLSEKTGNVMSLVKPEKGNTRYTYDAVGNQKAIVYPQAAISFAYDSLNRLTNVVDGLGTSTFSYTLAGELQSAGGLWSGDTVSYSYNNRLRSGLAVGAWSQSYGYDGVLRRLKQLAGEIAGGESAAQRPAGRPEIGGQ